MIRVIPKPAPTAQQLAKLRKLCGLSIAGIRDAARAEESIRDVAIFHSQWQSERLFLRELSREYSSDTNAYFIVHEVNDCGLNEALTPDDLKSRLEFWRGIELEQQMQSDLENGYISSPDEFSPHDDDWVQQGSN